MPCTQHEPHVTQVVTRDVVARIPCLQFTDLSESCFFSPKNFLQRKKKSFLVFFSEFSFHTISFDTSPVMFGSFSPAASRPRDGNFFAKPKDMNAPLFTLINYVVGLINPPLDLVCSCCTVSTRINIQPTPFAHQARECYAACGIKTLGQLVANNNANSMRLVTANMAKVGLSGSFAPMLMAAATAIATVRFIC